MIRPFVMPDSLEAERVNELAIADGLMAEAEMFVATPWSDDDAGDALPLLLACQQKMELAGRIDRDEVSA